MRVLFVGGYARDYPRNNIIKKGLILSGLEVVERRVSPKYRFWLRYPLLFLTSLGKLVKTDYIFVPEFCHKDVPLAKMLSLLSSQKIIFDPLASRFETKILDRKRKPESSWQARWNFMIDRLAFNLSDLVLSDTQAHKKYYSRTFTIPQEKIRVIPVGFDDEIFNLSKVKNKRKEDGKFRVLFFGSFLPLHGVDNIVRAAKILEEKDGSISFELVGGGETLLLAKSLASELNLENIRFGGWLPQRKLPEKIVNSDLCLGVFGSSKKARQIVPHKIFQSMAMRKAVVTADSPAIREFFKHRENIFLSEGTDPKNLADSILELREDASLREKIAENGFNLVLREFSPLEIGKRLAAILKEKAVN